MLRSIDQILAEMRRAERCRLHVKLYRKYRLGHPGAWCWRIEAKNGKTLAHSETYRSKQGAQKTAQLIADALGVELEQA